MSLGTPKIRINNLPYNAWDFEIVSRCQLVGYWLEATGFGSVPCRDNIFCQNFSEKFQTVSEGKPAFLPIRDVGLGFGVKEAEA
jgi:hypothetical protein